ncbi:MAG TPA: DedA family protein [Leptospiraceae bacterium]|nr:DedA family protein [Leptospiraceae bacterium]HNF14209.1 DedA family protein [Leptospiraceae bacterium]HNF23146.1 DedA family protein [Leptospiraceae bacterium]HNH08743.1 DedA family protein [Leptospiraceae bacterium]HNI96800.1 DedA family protein [Leptospiraceae bacterium]
MELLKLAIDFVLHIDRYLDQITREYGLLTYVILFLIIFAETGLVVTPFLPGDSLLFAIGAICALGSLNIYLIIGLLIIAAILGDTVNYAIGHLMKDRFLAGEKIKFIKQEHLNKTHEFYEKYGGKTIIIGRFIPIIRTFAPFVAGIGAMEYKKFILYNVIGGIVWVLIFTVAGYIFGGAEIIRKNFTLVIFAIILISVMPAVIEYIRHKNSPKGDAK